MQVGPLTLDLTTQRVYRDGREIDLTPTEFSLLELLMRFAGQVVTRRMLCEHLWEIDWEGTTNVIEVHINRLRGKLDKGYDESLIQTVRGRGYVLRAC
jgi:two-component system OmpR family response regulator/two-component system copper resistance phosphate regulon response regulator CusR